MKSFRIPAFYRSNFITPLKEYRRKRDKLKRDFAPTVLDFGTIKFLLARHFGFCYGVENAIDIAYKALDQSEGRRVFLLSEMIHNPDVNSDLQQRGVEFLMDTKGNRLIDWNALDKEDIVIVPAFGTTLEVQSQLLNKGIDVYNYDTTCPFVEKVWNRAEQIGQKDYTIVVHGKPRHEETRATFSHSKENAPTVVIKDMHEAKRLAEYIKGSADSQEFFIEFSEQYSPGFDPSKHLQRIGVVNQTTMLASDTQAIADFLRNVMKEHYKLTDDEIETRFANTRDTLCYATNDNQEATYALLEHEADLAIVAGGYNSSNTSHLVELCEKKLPTYFISSEQALLEPGAIRHYDIASKTEKVTPNYLTLDGAPKVLLTCGASCPDAVVEAIMLRLVSFFPDSRSLEAVMAEFKEEKTPP